MTITLSALALVVLASLGWGSLDLLRKMLVEKVAPLPLLCLLSAGMAPAFGLWLWLDGGVEMAAGYWPPALASVGLNVVANLAFFRAVKLSPLSVTIPMLSLTPVFVLLLAAVLLGELPTGRQVMGIALVVGGALLLNLSAGERGIGAVLRGLARESGTLLMALVALLWSASLAFDKLAVERASEAMHGLVVSLAIGLVTLIALAPRRRLGELGAAWREPLLVGLALVVGTVALGLQLVAIKLVWVALVETIKRGIGNLMALVLGRLVYAEPITRFKLVGVGLMAVGVALAMF